MATSRAPKVETVTFRIEKGLKTELAEIAAEESKPVGELLREQVRQRVERRARRQFEAEARRQSLELATAARDPNGDEAAMMREFDANFVEFAGEWK